VKLTFYLFNDTVTDFDAALDQAKLNAEDGFIEIELVDNLPFVAKAFFQQNRKTKPKWLDFISDYVNIDEEEIFNTTNSFLLLIRCENRIFAVNKGFGFGALNRKKLEKGFGLRVVLNEIDPHKIKSIDARNIDTTTKQKRVFINRNSPLYEFDFDFDEDLVNIISGQPSDAALARKLIGSDSLSITADIGFLELGDKCSQLLDSFNKDVYRQNFPFIDYLQVVKDEDLITKLENNLINNIENRSTEKLILAYPEIPDFEQIENFKIWLGRDKKLIEEVDLEQLYDFLKENELNADIENIHIIGLDNNDQAVTKKYSLHDFVVFETVFSDTRYLLSLNQWFELADNYVDEVNRELQIVPEIEHSFLPPLLYGQREDEYNQDVVKNRANIVLLDKHNYHVEGQSRVEVCDLLTQNKEFICVKKYNGSSTLSHLFNQGYVSATLLNDEQQYRQYIINSCPDGFVHPTISERGIEREGITFVFAIATNTPDQLAENLPFFSKVNLLKTNKAIRRMGFDVKIYKIDIVH
jgi:uncharacterized protein (TIGR04141 family)